MKKELVIISFAFIFLLTLSVVSASWFNDLFSEKSTGQAVKVTGDVQTTTTRIDGGKLATSISKSKGGNTNAFSRTPSTSSARESSSQDFKCPRGWDILSAREGGKCCGKAKNTGRSLFG